MRPFFACTKLYSVFIIGVPTGQAAISDMFCSSVLITRGRGGPNYPTEANKIKLLPLHISSFKLKN